MSDNKITRDVYRQYAKRIVNVLDGEDFYEQFKKRVNKGASEVKLSKKRLIQDISIDWIDTIEEILPNLDTIVRNPRKFIVQEEDIVDVSLARSISTESVKYLAQHTNMISKVDKDGSVTPSKILNITKEESFEIYENRFIYTLLLKLKDFVTMRYDKIKRATATQDVLDLEIESRFNLPSKKVTYRTEYLAQLSFDEVMRLDPDTLTKIERVAKIDRIITDFLSSSFAKSMRNSAPVRPPIMRTNVILKEPNFKKALTLWQFVETYNATAGFSTSDEVDEIPVDNADTDRLRDMVTLNTMLFESIYDQFETDMDMEDKEFADFLRVGDMDFQKDQIDRDEYAQKLDNEIKDQDEEKVEEVKATENQEAETELEPPPPQEKEKEEIEKEVEVEKIVEKEVVVEKLVEVEKFKELPPKDMDDQPDLEPDADKFDQHLFEVRKLFKRPDGDKIKQEEIIKVKDAIDRCLTAYRRIKQEELEERDRQERIRRRKLDIEKRAAAFRKQRDAIVSGEMKPEDSVYFGIDPFAAQRAKIEEEKKQKQREEEAAKLLAKKNEHLDLDNPDIEGVQKEIAAMEEENKKRKKRNAKIDKSLDTLDAMMPIEDEENMRFPKYAEPALEPEESAEEQPQEQAEEKPQEKPKAQRKQKIRISKDESSIDPWATKQPRQFKEITPVDESKVQVGGINLRGDLGITPWGEGKISVSNLAEKPAKEEKKPEKPASQEEKPKKPRKPRTPKPAPVPEAVEQPAPEPKEEQKLEEPVALKESIAAAKKAGGSMLGKKFFGEYLKGKYGDDVEVNERENKTSTGLPLADTYFAKDGENRKCFAYAYDIDGASLLLVNADSKFEADLKGKHSNINLSAFPKSKDEWYSLPLDDSYLEDEVKDVLDYCYARALGKQPEKKQAEPVAKPKKPRAPKVQEPEVKAEEPKVEAAPEVKQEEKPEEKPVKKPRKPKEDKGISPTTANQKYSKPSGKNKDITAVDESKVQVGGISGLDDPWSI